MKSKRTFEAVITLWRIRHEDDFCNGQPAEKKKRILGEIWCAHSAIFHMMCVALVIDIML